MSQPRGVRAGQSFEVELLVGAAARAAGRGRRAEHRHAQRRRPAAPARLRT